MGDLLLAHHLPGIRVLLDSPTLGQRKQVVASLQSNSSNQIKYLGDLHRTYKTEDNHRRQFSSNQDPYRMTDVCPRQLRRVEVFQDPQDSSHKTSSMLPTTNLFGQHLHKLNNHPTNSVLDHKPKAQQHPPQIHHPLTDHQSAS